MEQYFKSKVTQTKVILKKKPFLHYLQYGPKKVRILTNLIFFSFRLADDQKPFNAVSKNSNPHPQS